MLFRDLTPVLADDRGFAVVTDALARMVAEGADLIAGIDARGFLLGGAVAHRLGVGVLAIRKGGKLPPAGPSAGATTSNTARPPWRSRRPESSWPVAGSPSSTTCWPPAARWPPPATCWPPPAREVTEAAVVMELAALGGRERLSPLAVRSLQRV